MHFLLDVSPFLGWMILLNDQIAKILLPCTFVSLLLFWKICLIICGLNVIFSHLLSYRLHYAFDYDILAITAFPRPLVLFLPLAI